MLKLKVAAEVAVVEGGSFDQNIQAFVDEVRKRSILRNIEIRNKSATTGSVNEPASISGTADLLGANPSSKAQVV